MQIPAPQAKAKVLVVEDEFLVSWSACRNLEEWGYVAVAAGSLADARAQLARQVFDIVLLDIRLPDGRGLDLLSELPRGGPTTAIVLSAIGEAATIVEATKLGAADFLTKPCEAEDLREALLRVTVAKAAEQGPIGDRDELAKLGILSTDPAMYAVLDCLQRFARTPRSTVLLTGETGTGKSLAARILHDLSARAKGPFVEINCAAVPEALLESELMGHERGAYTDAKTARKGLIESADKGTLFLDEIGDMPLSMQAKLLRFIETHSYRRLGSNTETISDVRIVAATHMNLAQLVAEGRFRGDLYYRLKVLAVQLPPLRARPEDIELLARHMLRASAKEMASQVIGLSPAALALMLNHSWPGNVRELKFAIEAAVALCGDALYIEPAHLPPDLQTSGLGEQCEQMPSFQMVDGGPAKLADADSRRRPDQKSVDPMAVGALANGVRPAADASLDRSPTVRPLSKADVAPGDLETDAAPASDALELVFRFDGSMALADLERIALERAMQHSEGNQVRAAKLLGVSRDLLRYRLRKYGLMD